MLIIDTCVFIWLGLDTEQISERAFDAIQNNDLAISDITFLELGFLIKKGRLDLSCELSEFCSLVTEAHAISAIRIDGDIVQTAMNLPAEVNNDPADRIISATSLFNGCDLITADNNLRNAHSVPTIW